MNFSKYLIVSIFVLVFVGALSLGVWQIDRGYAKKALENAFSERQSLPVETNPGELNQDLYYRKRDKILQDLFVKREVDDLPSYIMKGTLEEGRWR